MKLAVLGSPIAHSLSPVMHNAALRACGLFGEYEAREVDERGFVAAIGELRGGELAGANVTMPHKRLAYDMCDVPSAFAERAGAVNTLSHVGGEVLGDNTDVMGIREAWGWTGLADDAPVVVLGAGGAAAAALLALEGHELTIQARRRTAAEELVDRTGVDASVVEWEKPTSGAIVVNATPIGMRGQRIADSLLSGAIGLFDMAYGDRATPAVIEMRRRRLPVAEGLDMLIGQAVASFRIWTRRDVDPEVMRGAALSELLRRRETEEA